MFGKILEILAIPIMILNIGGGIVGGIWLAFLGQWKLIGIGIALLFTSNWALSLLMMPSILIGGIGISLLGKNKFFLYLSGYISQVYINILIIGTCAFAFFLCSIFYRGGSEYEYIPYILWSWGMALGPWQFFASKEPENEFSAITLFSASIFYFLFLVSVFVHPGMSLIVIGLFAIVHLIVLPIFNIYIANEMDKSPQF